MGSKFVIYVALASDLGIAIIKFIAAAATGSAAMLSEGIHSIIDATNQLLLLTGIKRSQKKPDAERPFGYGRELYFWSFIVSLLLFSVGGCISFYEGILQFQRRTQPKDITWNYIVLAVAFVLTIISLTITFKKFNKQRGELSFWKAFTKSKDPAIFIVLLSDFGDLAGLVIAFLGVYLGHYFHDPYYDAVASMIIGSILVVISLLLVRECRSLLMGESAGRKTLQAIITLAESDVDIIKVKQHYSIYLAPEEVVLQLMVVFKKNLSTKEIADAIRRVRENIRQLFPYIKQIFIEPE